MSYVAIGALIFIILLSALRIFNIPFFLRGLQLGFNWDELTKIKSLLISEFKTVPSTRFFKDNRLLGNMMIKFHLSSEGQKATLTIEKFYKLRHQLAKIKSPADDKNARIAAHTLTYGSQMTISSKSLNTPVKAMVIKNKEYLVLYPESEILDNRISVYFWYQDAGYSFKSKIIKRENGHIWITQPKNIALERRRHYTRVNLDIPVIFTVISDLQKMDYHPEIEMGQKGQLKNISEGGLNLVTSGQGRQDLIMKLKFELRGQPIVVCAVVKAVSYNKETNESVLNLEFIETPPIKMYEPILSYIYDLNDNHYGGA